MPEIVVDKSWVEGNQLYVKASCDDRETLTEGIRGFVSKYVMQPENKLGGWGEAGVEKCECPLSFDPNNPDGDIVELSKAASKRGEVLKLRYSQVVRLTRKI